ncbi:branched-chain amino acid ABC transporter permease [Pseudorhodoferax sp.]|uniref:branched-chain amino acid ABC transporter permease n=1 Tax=Pseudorhodoferax sp. TaxID=1993553 RepID=UPI002DD6AA53|nr:branched-chain amino acid ABC transporter permease [Pseudorhodoferax sp.]
MGAHSLSWRSPRVWLAGAIVLLMLLVPLFAQWAGSSFYLGFATRIVVFAIAASGLNLVLGYGGLVSLGHALYVGLGAYVVGIAAFHGLTNGWAQLFIALALAAGVAAVTGLVSLRTRGIGFIMITLAFGQMFYFLAVSLKQYGGDDGLPLNERSQLAPLPALDSKVALYYLALALLLLVMFGVWRAVHSRFGMVLRGFHANERRMLAAGFPRLRYQLTAYVASALVCTLAGVLQGNLTAFASPSYLSWQASGELILIVVLGGMGTVMGPLVGAVVLLVLEEALSGWTQHWMAILGPLILLVALVSRRGIWGVVLQWEKRK